MKPLKNQNMQRTMIKATFKGEPGSLGFEVEKEHELTLEVSCQGKVTIMHNRPGTLIGYQLCEYSNFRKFLDNWKNINNP